MKTWAVARHGTDRPSIASANADTRLDNSPIRSSLEARVEAEARHHRGVDVLQLPGRIERLLERRLDDLQIQRRRQPPRDRGIVVHLDRVLLLQPELELLTQERHEVPGELRVRPADPEAVPRPPRHDALATEANVVRVLDRIDHAVR